MSIERAALEAEVKHVKELLAAYEAEPVAGYVWKHPGSNVTNLTFNDPRYGIETVKLIRKPTSTAHLEAVKAQVWNEAMEEAARICNKLAEEDQLYASTRGFEGREISACDCEEAIRLAKKGEQP